MAKEPPAIADFTSPTALEPFLEAAPDAIVVIDSAGRMVIANGVAGRLFGYDREELLGHPIEMLVPSRLQARHGEHRERYFREPRTRPMGEGLELAGRRKDGTEFPVEISLSPLATPDRQLVISIIRDVGDRRKTEAQFRSFLEAGPDAIVMADRQGRIVLLNSQTERLFGYHREELLGRPVETLVPARFHERHVAHRAGYFTDPRVRPMGSGFELFGRRRDGAEFPVEISLSPIETDEGVLVSAAIRDITDRKQVENRLRASLQEKEVLLREIHHRVKNNLQIVSSMLNLQMEQLHDKEALVLFQESQARVHSIALFHEKLYQSRDLSRVSIADYLDGLVAGLVSTYGVNPDRIALRTSLQDVPMSVDAAIASGLIVNELVSNALKYAFPDEREGEVSIGLRREGSEVVIEVHDNGVGFPAGLDFRSAGSLGLKLVTIFTEQTGGRLDLDRNGGTRFTVRFPSEDAP
jgi:PAS domain S-box-containing protein